MWWKMIKMWSEWRNFCTNARCWRSKTYFRFSQTLWRLTTSRFFHLQRISLEQSKYFNVSQQHLNCKFFSDIRLLILWIHFCICQSDFFLSLCDGLTVGRHMCLTATVQRTHWATERRDGRGDRQRQRNQKWN